MKRERHAHGFRASQLIYERLLVAYPISHRAEYGAAMVLLFRDQCRDAWNESRNWGLFKLWMRVLPDLASTSVLERLAALRERKTMSDKLANLSGFRTTPISTFIKVFVTVFLLVFITSVVITYLLPESYASTARIRVEPDAPTASGQNGQLTSYDPYFVQTTFEMIRSPIVLDPVISRLKLNEAWGKKYFNGQTLKNSETAEILKQRLQLAPVRNTELISITAYSDDRNEAAQIANAVAESYRDYRALIRDETTEKALTALRRQYDEQGQQIRMEEAELNALHAKFGIMENVDGLGGQLANAQASFREKDVELSRLRALNNIERRNALATSDKILSDLLVKLNDAEQQYATLTNDYSLTHVQVTRVTSLIGVLNSQIDDRVNGLMSGLESQLVSFEAASKDLAAEIQKSKPTAENQSYWETKHNLEQLNESHKALFAKIEEQKLEAQIPKPVLVQITDPAEPGYAPVKPNKTVNIVLGAVAGIFLATGAGAVFALLSFLVGRQVRKTAAATI
jgi:uncharacterized protein involved in exopolysaccharide biosynthesis